MKEGNSVRLLELIALAGKYLTRFTPGSPTSNRTIENAEERTREF